MSDETETQLALIDEFIAEHGLTMTVKPASGNPHMDPKHNPNMRHWLCTITGTSVDSVRPMTVYFSQGSAHTKPPTLADVLDCLASDAATVENTDGFEAWADELGYNTDSRNAENTYDTIQDQSDNLKDLLGEQAFQALLYKVERL